MPEQSEPDLSDLLTAAGVVRRHVPATPLLRARALEPLCGREVYVKCENHAPTGSFKIRGALAALCGQTRPDHAVTASTGNHGAAVAHAAARAGVSATIVVPVGTAPKKIALARESGATLEIIGDSFEDAVAAARKIAAESGGTYLEDGEDLDFMSGAASLTWEVLEELPEPATWVVPTGGGNLLAAVALAVRLAHPRAQVIGVQSRQAPAVYESWHARRAITAPCSTRAAGLATNRPGSAAFHILRERVASMCLVDDAEIFAAIRRGYEAIGEIAEPAAASSIAALPHLGSTQPGPVVVLLSGGNATVGELAAAFAQD